MKKTKKKKKNKKIKTRKILIPNLYNKGSQTALGVQTDMYTDCEYVSVHPSNLFIAEFPGNETMNFAEAGRIQIADNVPDLTSFTLNLTTITGSVERTTSRQFQLLAPNLQFAECGIEDYEGDQNGYIDPGERAILHIHGKNAGHALASGTYLTVTCNDERLQIEQNTVQIGSVESDSSFIADLFLTADADIISGTTFSLDLTLQTGSYTTTLTHLLSVGRALETFESGDFSFLDWFHEGDLPWTVTDEEAHSGNYCARSGAIGDDEVTKLIMYADLLADGEISFWFKTSTDARKDIFAFYIDNRKQDWWWGENDWTYTSYELTAGSHAFIWLYDKNINGSAGEDCVWVDDISFPRACIITGVEEVTEQKTTTLYPNPTTGSFTIELAEESNIGIYNMLGQQVMQLNKASGNQQIHLENAPKGMYLVQIQSESMTETKKLILE